MHASPTRSVPIDPSVHKCPTLAGEGWQIPLAKSSTNRSARREGCAHGTHREQVARPLLGSRSGYVSSPSPERLADRLRHREAKKPVTSSLFELLQRQAAAWLPLLIFGARVVDVSLGTVRTILVVRGQRTLAAAIGFLEVTVWLLAVSSVVNAFHQPLNVLGYASGYAVGNYVGVWIEGRLAIGEQVVRLFSSNRTVELAARLSQASFDSVKLVAEDSRGPLGVLFVTTSRRQVPALLRLVREVDPDASFTVEDLRNPVPVAAPWRLPPLRGLRFAPNKK